MPENTIPPAPHESDAAPPEGAIVAPTAPETASSRFASSVSSTGFGVDPDASTHEPLGRGASWALFLGVLAALVALGTVVNGWTFTLVLVGLFVIDAAIPGQPDPRLAPARLAGITSALVVMGLSSIWLLVVVFAIALMITLHELGHYLTAKRAGMKVTEFFLGFGPKLWSMRRGETEYGLKLIPAGAYVKIPGMVNLDEVAPEDEATTYRQKGFGQRVSVAVAGSAMHFMLAFVLIYVALVFVGQPAGSLTSGPNNRPPLIEQVIPTSGASDAGLQAGDTVTVIDGNEISSSSDLRSTVAPLKGTTVPVTFLRDGSEQQAEVALKAYEYEGVSSCGMGIVMAQPEIEKVSPVKGLVETPKQFGSIVALSAKGLGSFFSPSGISDFASQVGSAQDDADQSGEPVTPPANEDPCDPNSVAATTSASSGTEGENRILSIYGLVRIGSSVGGVDPGALIGLFALINIFIGMFNLVPLLPFDGGHVAIAVYELIQEKRHRVRRYFTDVSRLQPLTYGVVVVLGLLFISSLYLDVVNPIGG